MVIAEFAGTHHRSVGLSTLHISRKKWVNSQPHGRVLSICWVVVLDDVVFTILQMDQLVLQKNVGNWIAGNIVPCEHLF